MPTWQERVAEVVDKPKQWPSATTTPAVTLTTSRRPPPPPPPEQLRAMDAEQAAEASTPTPPPAAADKAAAVICECNGVIRLQHVREQLEAIAENPAGDSLRDVAETQRFVEHLANFVNTIVPIHATAATLRNLHDAALWLTKIINTISRKKMGI